MKPTLTVLAHRRPHLLRQTLAALGRCHGLDRWRVLLVADDPSVDTRLAVYDFQHLFGWEHAELDLRQRPAPPYSRVSRATRHALAMGFAESDFVAHLEEDCVPAPDFLEFMEWAAREYRWQPVTSVGAWWAAPPEWAENPPAAALYAVTAETVPELGVATWGVGTWRDRWHEINELWNEQHWDRNMVHGGGLMVHPLVSRIRNIGREGTQPTSEYDLRARVDTPAFLPDAPAGRWAQL